MRMKTPRTYIKTLDQLKVSNLSGRLIKDIDRVVPPDTTIFQEAVVRAGAPGTGQSMRYLPFNRQIHVDGDVTITLSLVVLFNNLRMERFFLKGLHERVSRFIYKFSFNVMDGFIRSVRLDRQLLQIMSAATGAFSIMGIVQRDEIQRHRFYSRRLRTISPLLLVPIVDAASHAYIVDFEKRQAIEKKKVPLLPIYRKTPRTARD